jgi:hypothetical protein
LPGGKKRGDGGDGDDDDDEDDDDEDDENEQRGGDGGEKREEKEGGDGAAAAAAERRKKRGKRKGVANEGRSEPDAAVVDAASDGLIVPSDVVVPTRAPSPPPTPPPTPTPPSPHPTVAEPVCKSIIAVGSSRLRPDDPHLLALPPERRRALYDDSDYDEEFVCELRSTGDTVPLLSSSRQLRALREALQDGILVSGVSTVEYVIPELVDPPPTAEGSTPPRVSPPPSSGGESDVPPGAVDDLPLPGGSPPPPLSPPPSSGAPAASPSPSPPAQSSSLGGGETAPALPTPPPSRASTATASAATTSTASTVVIGSVALPPGDVVIRTDPDAVARERGRRSLRLSGDRPVLVVRVAAWGEGGSVSADARAVSDKFFGTSGDAVTMASQFAGCSYGRFGVSIGHPDHDGKLSAPGVLEVDIPMTLDNPRTAIRQAMQRAAEEKLGTRLPGPFGHVLFVQGRCRNDCGWAAYAYVNSWLSVYQGDYFMYPAVALHEMGHNLNFGHSGGLDLKTYSDHTCLMGNPLYKDDVADMCFNPAKNYQITANGGGWYDPWRVETFDTSRAAAWEGMLVGVAEYGALLDGSNAEHARSRVVLKLETGTSIDLYVGFNRATGINGDNKQASDMVTIVEANGDGRGYSTSALKATLAQGQSYAVADWRGTGVTLTVYVDAIRRDVVPGYAAVRVVLGGDRAGGVRTLSPTERPSRVPTSTRPTRAPVRKPTPPPKPTLPPTPPPTLPPTPPPTIPPTPLPTHPVSSWMCPLFCFVHGLASPYAEPACCALFPFVFIALGSSLRYPLRIPPLNQHCRPPLKLHCRPPLNLHSLPPYLP